MKRVVVTADSHFPSKSDCGFALIDVSNPLEPVVQAEASFPIIAGVSRAVTASSIALFQAVS